MFVPRISSLIGATTLPASTDKATVPVLAYAFGADAPGKLPEVTTPIASKHTAIVPETFFLNKEIPPRHKMNGSQTTNKSLLYGQDVVSAFVVDLQRSYPEPGRL
jgi:hypothetical protein